MGGIKLKVDGEVAEVKKRVAVASIFPVHNEKTRAVEQQVGGQQVVVTRAFSSVGLKRGFDLRHLIKDDCQIVGEFHSVLEREAVVVSDGLKWVEV